MILYGIVPPPMNDERFMIFSCAAACSLVSIYILWQEKNIPKRFVLDALQALHRTAARVATGADSLCTRMPEAANTVDLQSLTNLAFRKMASSLLWTNKK